MFKIQNHSTALPSWVTILWKPKKIHVTIINDREIARARNLSVFSLTRAFFFYILFYLFFFPFCGDCLFMNFKHKWLWFKSAAETSEEKWVFHSFITKNLLLCLCLPSPHCLWAVEKKSIKFQSHRGKVQCNSKYTTFKTFTLRLWKYERKNLRQLLICCFFFFWFLCRFQSIVTLSRPAAACVQAFNFRGGSP